MGGSSGEKRGGTLGAAPHASSLGTRCRDGWVPGREPYRSPGLLLSGSRGLGRLRGGKPGLLWAMEAVWHKAAKQGAQAAGEEGEAGPGSARCPPSARPCRLLGPKHMCLHAGWKRGGLQRAPPGIPREAGRPLLPLAWPWAGSRHGYGTDTACTLARSPDSGLALRHRPSERAGEAGSCKTQAPHLPASLHSPSIPPA